MLTAALTAVETALATDGFAWLAVAAILAGLVRGFTGFGTAMVYLPIAGQFLPPVQALVTLILIDFIGPMPAVPRAIREGHTRDVMRLVAGVLIGAPIGVAILLLLPPDAFRAGVSLISLALLAALISGVRYTGTVSRPMIYGIGGISGILHGAAGLPGPPVILLYMARPLPVEVIRASVLLFLFLADILVMAIFGIRGLLDGPSLVLGLCLVPPYLAAVMLGARLFHPRLATVYRWAAYTIIAVSAISGLPIWS